MRRLGPILLICGLAMSSLVGGIAVANEAAHSYRLDRWIPSDGLPSWQVRDLLEGPEGYLWIATPAGIVRFDGQRFHRIDRRTLPNLPTNRIQSLHAARDGSIWVGGEDFLLRLHRRSDDLVAAETVARVEGLVHAVGEDATGGVWVFRDDGRLDRVEAGATVPAAPARAEGLVVDRDGRIWIREPDGSIGVVENGVRVPTERRQVVPSTPLWVLHRRLLTSHTDGTPLDVRRDGDRLVVREPDGTPVASLPDAPDAIPWLVDRHGQLWVARAGRVEVYCGEGEVPLIRQELGDDVLVSEILEDREGNLWIGTRANGIFRMRPDIVEVYTHPPARLFRGFTRDADGSLQVEAEDGLYRVTPEGLAPLLDPSGVHVTRLHLDAAGRRWVGRGETLSAEVDGRTVTVEGVTGTRFANIAGRTDGFFMTDTHGLAWIDVEDGVTERRFADRIDGLALLHGDAAGRLWIAGPGGLFVLEDGGEPLPVDLDAVGSRVSVRAFLEEDDGTLWLGTINHGLVRFRDGRASGIDATAGLPDDGVFALLEDTRGRFWMSGNRGIFRVRRSEIDAYLAGETTRVNSAYFVGDAVRINPEEGGNLGAVDDDGLWFSTHTGVVRLDPATADELSTTPPRVHLEYVRAGEEPVEIGVDGATLRPDQRRLEFGYTAISLRDPGALRFEVRLDPFDRDWVRVGTDRRVRYRKLPPGRYTFRVRALSGGGIWSEEEAAVPLQLRPHPWETTSFRTLVVLAVLVGGVAWMRMRTRSHRLRAEELDREVRARTEELAAERDRAAETSRLIEAQARKLAELDATKSRFFANVSHEFRTPLTLILGPLDDVLEGRHGEVSAAAAEQIRLANQNGARLLRLVNQLLDTARLEAGRLALHCVEEDLAVVLRRVAAIFEPFAEREGIAFDVDVPDAIPGVWIDEEQFEKVLVNLLGNAFKFTESGGRIALEAEAGVDEAVLRVVDSGPGIAAEDLERVFDRFYQSSKTGSDSGAGTGIGLALTRDLVELHHGAIAVHSVPGEGATFEVRLPTGADHLTEDQRGESPSELERRLRRARADEAARRLVVGRAASANAVPASSEEASDGDRTTVLVVEDNEEMRRFIADRLAPDYHVVQAGDGRSAMERIGEHVPDLVVSDLMMPGLDGLELCRRVKSDPELDFVPFILLTARASVESRLEGLGSGADDYLSKPFDARELLARVGNLLESRRRLRARLESREERLPALPEDVRPAAEDDVIARAMEAIDDHLGDETFGVDELARALGQSRRTLYRRLTEAGVAPATLIQRRRLDHAFALLRERRGSVTDVAYAVGFRSVSHFSRRFREQHGKTPSAVRRGSESDDR